VTKYTARGAWIWRYFYTFFF